MKKSKIPRVIILIGPPGSGKGTQAKLLCEKFNFEYIGSGDTFRARQKIPDFTGKKLTQVMNKGKLAPSFIVIKIFGEKLDELQKEKKIKGLVLDGWTRTLPEAILIEEALDWYGWGKYFKVLLIKISKKESINRLTKRRQCKKCGRLIPWVGEFKKLKKCDKCGGELFFRPDDKIEVIQTRLEEYERETIPAINYYKKEGKLIVINGEQSIEDVFKEILEKLK
jgi:adenylate kinase